MLAATNRDLAEEVRAGRFRAVLYHRLSVYPLRAPPLRERGRDVTLLAGYFLEENRPRLGLRSLRLAPDIQPALVGHQWPGNVRELEHLIGRASLKALAACHERPRILSLQAIDLELLQGNPTNTAVMSEQQHNPLQLEAGDLRQTLDNYQRLLISDCLSRHQGSWAAAACELGLDRANLNRLARRLALK